MRSHPIPTLVLLFAAYLLLRRPQTWGFIASIPFRALRSLLTGGKR